MLKPSPLSIFFDKRKLKWNTSLIPCAVPFRASWLAGIQIAQINGLEFVESWIQTMCSLQEGLCKLKPFPWKKTHTHTFCCACRFVRAPMSHTESRLVNPVVTPGLCLLLREKGRREERIKRFPPLPLLSINSFSFPLSLPSVFHIPWFLVCQPAHSSYLMNALS